MRMATYGKAVLALGVMGFLGCGKGATEPDAPSPEDGSQAIDSSDFNIINGTPATGMEYDAVVALVVQLGAQQVLCSGTLIDPKHVLTAAHCLDEGLSIPRAVRPSNVSVYFGDTLEQGTRVSAAEATIHPDYDRFAITSDIAVIELEEAVTSVTPIPRLDPSRALSNSDIGETIDLVGFGVTEDDETGTRLHFVSEISALGCPYPECGGAGSEETTFSYLMDDGGVCFGDSGGPALLERNGTVYVAGVTSFGDVNCVVVGASARVAAFDGWMAEQLDDDPNPNPNPNPSTGDQCSASDESNGRTLEISCSAVGSFGICRCTVDGRIAGICTTSDANNECSPFAGCCDTYF